MREQTSEYVAYILTEFSVRAVNMHFLSDVSGVYNEVASHRDHDQYYRAVHYQQIPRLRIFGCNLSSIQELKKTILNDCKITEWEW